MVFKINPRFIRITLRSVLSSAAPLVQLSCNSGQELQIDLSISLEGFEIILWVRLREQKWCVLPEESKIVPLGWYMMWDAGLKEYMHSLSELTAHKCLCRMLVVCDSLTIYLRQHRYRSCQNQRKFSYILSQWWKNDGKMMEKPVYFKNDLRL